MLQFVTIIFINKMHSNEQPNPRSRSLKDAIYQAITAHKVKSVASLLRNTHKRIHQNLQASQRSLLRSQYQSPIIQTHLSHNRYTPSPSSFAHSKSSTHRSPNYLQPKHCQRHKKEAKKGGTGKLGSRQKYIPNKMRMKNLKGKKLKKPLEASRGSELLTRSHDRSLGIQSRSKERGSSNMNLSSIVQQQSSESNLMTPCSKRSRFGKNQKRQFEGEQTHKKQKNGVKEVVWRRLERCIKEPQRFHSLLKSEMLGIRFRIIRKKIIQIQVLVQRQLISLSIFLQKGNLQCQSVHERFQNLKAGANFSLYSSVRAVDLDHALHLPKLQVEAVSSQELKFQKMITLPYCWLHFAEESLLPHASKSRIKTKVCIEEFLASKNQLKVLGGVLANWECKSPSRGEFVWSSRLLVAQEEFQLKFIQKDGNVAGEVAGRGEQRLTRMMQFLTALLS